MKRIVLALCLILPLSACAGAWSKTKSWFNPRPEESGLLALITGGQSAAALDAVSDAQKAAAVAAPVEAPNAGQVLGVVSVALGSPAEQGLWLKSNLVAAPSQGRAVLANGAGVNVDLLPSTGGATLSFSAYRALGLALTDLPEVQVLSLP
jgi:hypothetical protein